MVGGVSELHKYRLDIMKEKCACDDAKISGDCWRGSRERIGETRGMRERWGASCVICKKALMNMVRSWCTYLLMIRRPCERKAGRERAAGRDETRD